VDKGVTPDRVELNNHPSASQSSSLFDQANEQVLKEIENGNYVPVKSPPSIVSPLGAIPKPDGGVRLIHDCSRPIGKAVNDYVSALDHHKFSSVDDAAKLIQPNYFMSKVDLKSAYRSVSIHSSSYEFTGLKWPINGKDCYFYDSKLPFGAKMAPGIFHRLSQAVVRIMGRLGCKSIIGYLDDFFICEPSFKKCANTLRLLIAVLRKLGFSISWSKVTDPCKVITFLGIELDTESMELRLPEDKLKALKQELLEFSTRVRANKRQLQSLAGKLNWAASVVTGGRTFIRRIIDAIKLLKQDCHKIRLRAGVLSDIGWWLKFMPSFNGRAAIITTSAVVAVYTDACMEAGAGHWGSNWFHTEWRSEWPQVSDCHINEKEVLAAATAVALWGHRWQDHTVYIFSDNTVTVSSINKSTSKNSKVMEAIRFLFWQSVTYNFKLKAVHIPGKYNVLADKLSRLQEMAPGEVCECISSVSHDICFPNQVITCRRLYDLCSRSPDGS
jgi:hypothetical protein